MLLGLGTTLGCGLTLDISLDLKALGVLFLLRNWCGFIVVNVNHGYDLGSLFALLQKFGLKFLDQL